MNMAVDHTTGAAFLSYLQQDKISNGSSKHPRQLQVSSISPIQQMVLLDGHANSGDN